MFYLFISSLPTFTSPAMIDYFLSLLTILSFLAVIQCNHIWSSFCHLGKIHLKSLFISWGPLACLLSLNNNIPLNRYTMTGLIELVSERCLGCFKLLTKVATFHSCARHCTDISLKLTGVNRMNLCSTFQAIATLFCKVPINIYCF